MNDEHTKIVLADKSFYMASISVAAIVKTQFSVFPNFSEIFRSHSSTIFSDSSFQIFSRRQSLYTGLLIDVSPQIKVTGQVRKSCWSACRGLPPSPVIVASSIQISTYLICSVRPGYVLLENVFWLETPKR